MARVVSDAERHYITELNEAIESLRDFYKDSTGKDYFQDEQAYREFLEQNLAHDTMYLNKNPH